VVCGRHDLDFFAAVARHLVAGLPAAKYVELPWAGHLPNLERPDETTALIRRAITHADR
jgi:pimeloyl-ACP methyl ester carboxylesterase